MTENLGVRRLNYNNVIVSADKQASFPMKLYEYANQKFAAVPIRKKTLATYSSMFRCHIRPRLGEHDLEEVRRSEVKELISKLPPQTAATTLSIIKMLYREAMDEGLVEKSPVHGLVGPKVMVIPRRFLRWEELEKINFGKWNHQIRFLALHGLRWSEAVAHPNRPTK
jgi:integrase